MTIMGNFFLTYNYRIQRKDHKINKYNKTLRQIASLVAQTVKNLPAMKETRV